MTAVLEAVGLRKTFGSFSALDGLDLQADQGEVHGFLGPNGAGKSTTIRVLFGLYRPCGGEVRLFGQNPWDRPDQLHRRLAYVPGDVNLWPSLTGGEAIDLLIGLRGGAPASSDRARLIEAFEFDPTKRIRTYSKGNRQKVALIAAFALPAELYIFDEPTSGLDPLMAQRFQDEVARVASGGASVLLSSHILAEVEEVADRISIIRQGRRVETGTLAQLRHLTRTTYTIPVRLPPGDADRLARVAHDITAGDGRTTFTVEPEDTSKVLAVLAKAEVPGVTAHPPSLEELFLRHYGDEQPVAHPPAPNVDAARR
ncbi:ATP-binding cassette domain-containing protein [Ruania zhangjianzhongii]|uniref:ABC transporter ATP-binding protein n=1 Tax=Ruania zhangjianzhongii TaxID=2603206 RepID=UPI001651E1D9|nr:ABC transporter ATP-binding protein [Ruania zhangjianzhongii]